MAWEKLISSLEPIFSTRYPDISQLVQQKLVKIKGLKIDVAS